jgi:hypothetical protein
MLKALVWILLALAAVFLAGGIWMLIELGIVYAGPLFIWVVGLDLLALFFDRKRRKQRS